MNDLGSSRFGLRENAVVGDRARIDANPQLPRAEVRNDGWNASNVIGVCMGDGDGIEAANAAKPENRRDYILTNIEIPSVSIWIACVRAPRTDDTACVDEEGLAMRRDDENRVALTNVDRGYLENPPR